MAQAFCWWKHGVIYQVYPRSFQDTNGDGIGDLPGVVARLDYLADTLGVDALWLSPFFRSPMADYGYDVADYCDTDPLFGTLEDAELLIEACHRRGLRLIIDYVPNHTSDRHPWFQASRSSRDDPKRDWFFWRDPKPDGSLPNNWLGNFGGPTWTWDPSTEQYYLHLFLPEQPDLNWRNPAVREAMYEVMRFWLGRGVDGFRIDVAHYVMKDPELRDNPPAPPRYQSGLQTRLPYDSQLHLHDKGHPDVHGVFREMRAVVDAYPDRFTVGEITELDPEVWVSYYGDGDGLHMPFNFSLVQAPWEADWIKRRVDTVESILPPFAWPNYVVGNHDVHRIATRAGSEQRARVAMMMLLTLRGTPTLYYGDELALPQAAIPSHRLRDPWALREPGQGRDGCRTPMLWDRRDPNAGFCPGDAEPWLPLGPAAAETSVADHLTDPQSMLSLTRALLDLRRRQPALHLGDYAALEGSPQGCFGYLRRSGGTEFAVALNFTPERVDLAAIDSGSIALSTGMDRLGERVRRGLSLGPDEGIVVRRD